MIVCFHLTVVGVSYLFIGFTKRVCCVLRFGSADVSVVKCHFFIGVPGDFLNGFDGYALLRH